MVKETIAYDETLGGKLWRLREDAQWTHTQLAEKVNQEIEEHNNAAAKETPVTRNKVKEWEINNLLPTETEFEALVNIVITKNASVKDEDKESKKEQLKTAYKVAGALTVTARTGSKKLSDPDSFCNLLNNLREDAGLTQTQLSELVSTATHHVREMAQAITPEIMREIEHGHITPTQSQLSAINAVFKKTVEHYEPLTVAFSIAANNQLPFAKAKGLTLD